MLNNQLILAALSLREFKMTETELKLIASAATIGESNMPKFGYNNPAANGIPIAGLSIANTYVSTNENLHFTLLT